MNSFKTILLSSVLGMVSGLWFGNVYVVPKIEDRIYNQIMQSEVISTEINEKGNLVLKVIPKP